MNVLDLCLLVAALSFAVSGYRQGFLVGALSFTGFLGGGVAGMVAAPALIAGMTAGAAQAVAAVAVVVGSALVGQLVLTVLGRAVRGRVTWRPAAVLDAAAGAALSVAALLVVSWFVASALREAPVPALTRAVRESTVLTTVDRAMPDAARGLFASLRDVLDRNGLPRVFGGLAPERILPVDPPDTRVRLTPGVAAAADSVVKVTGSADRCDREVEGSGFVYAPEHVLTNAHVVAGVADPGVQVRGRGRVRAATVVAFDPRRDLAVLFVPGLAARALRFDASAGRGDTAVVAGFPRGGAYRLDAARVRERLSARGPDIYGRTQVTRSVLSLYTNVQPGNSGGPLLSPQGRVYGVVFAKSVDDPETGYALTVSEASAVATRAERATTEVGTGDCVD